MKVIGLTGGIGSGKSTVLDILNNEYNAYVMLADDIGRLAMEIGSQTYYQMIEEFGKIILNEDKSINTSIMADIIMSDEDKLNIQNRIVHPFVINYIKTEIERMKDTDRLVVIESAILYEAGCEGLCDRIWVVTADADIRIKRLMDSRGYSRERAVSFMELQMSEEEYVNRADAVIYNNGDIEELKKRLDVVIKSI